MTPKTKKILIYTGGTLISIGVAYTVYAIIRNKGIQSNILKNLAGGAGQYGTLQDFAGFKGQAYRDSISTSFNVIKLQDATARQYADTLHKAFGFFSDDIATITNVFNQIKDQYELSQVASVYQAVYTNTLLSDLMKLNNTNQDTIYKIVKLYKPYRVS